MSLSRYSCRSRTSCSQNSGVGTKSFLTVVPVSSMAEISVMPGSVSATYMPLFNRCGAVRPTSRLGKIGHQTNDVHAARGDYENGLISAVVA